jgi:hypothetical protein
MQITRISLDTQAVPSDWFAGSVYIDTVGTPSGALRWPAPHQGHTCVDCAARRRVLSSDSAYARAVGCAVRIVLIVS